MSLYIQKINLSKKPLKQAKIDRWLVKSGEKPIKPVKEVSQVIVLSSEEDLPPSPKKPKRLRRSLNRCMNCQDLLHDCSCDQRQDENHQVVQMTLDDPKVKSYNNKLNDMADFLKDKIRDRDNQKVAVDEWLNWLILWSENRGRCVYATGDKGLAPASAKNFFNLFQKVIKDNFGWDFVEKFPQASKFANQWQKYICREKLYRRTQANYFSKDDVKDYVTMFNHVISNGSSSKIYYAMMAKVVLTVSIIFAGCRVGALLDIRLGAVSFFSVGEHKYNDHLQVQEFRK